MTRHASIPVRIRQAIAHVRQSADLDPIPLHLARFLSPEAAERFQQLQPFDRSHVIAVANSLIDRGASDDLVTAGLLHDIGKADAGRSIRLIDRAAYAVLPKRVARRWARTAVCRALLPGFPALANHAQTGARWLDGWDYPPRVGCLVRHHEQRTTSDPELAALNDADAHSVAATR